MKKSIILGMMGLYFIIVSSKFAVADIAMQNSDAEVLGVLSVIDQNEIQAAQLAEQKTINSKILDYARKLDLDHNKHLDETRRLSQELGMVVEDNASLEKLRNNGLNDRAALTALDENEFAQLFIADTIKGHVEALDWVEIQDAHNEQLRNFLEETQKGIALYLQKAQKIQEHLINEQ